jgi:hypothetical protein
MGFARLETFENTVLDDVLETQRFIVLDDVLI